MIRAADTLHIARYSAAILTTLAHNTILLRYERAAAGKLPSTVQFCSCPPPPPAVHNTAGRPRRCNSVEAGLKQRLRRLRRRVCPPTPSSCAPNDSYAGRGLVLTESDDDFIPWNTPPLTQHTAAKRPAAPTHECTGPAGTGPRRIATEEKGRVSGTATGQPKPI